MITSDEKNAASATESLLEALRLPDNFAQAPIGVRQPLRPTFGKLNKHRFSRVHPSPEYKYPTVLVADKDSMGEAYLAAPNLIQRLGSMAKPKILRLAVDNAGVPRLVAEPIAAPNDRQNLWNDSMIRAIYAGETDWVRVEPNTTAGQYEIIKAQGDLGEPQWPEQSMNELVLECFKDRIIQDPSHPLILQLEGRV